MATVNTKFAALCSDAETFLRLSNWAASGALRDEYRRKALQLLIDAASTLGFDLVPADPMTEMLANAEAESRT